MQVLKIKDCVPIEELIGLGFKERHYENGKKWENCKYVPLYTTDYFYKFCDGEMEIEFSPKTKILYLSTCDQTHVPIPNVFIYMIRNQMVELIEMEDWTKC